MATKEAIFDLESVKYSKETQILDYSFETANINFYGNKRSYF
nr:MAG TPA: Cytoplasmic dynein 1 intermediate chain 2 [Caudoviricetes sp.]